MSGVLTRRTLLWSLLLLGPSLAVSGWLLLWFQWMLPTEDGPIEALAAIAASLIAGAMLGIGRFITPTGSGRWKVAAVVAACMSRELLMLLGGLRSVSFAALRFYGFISILIVVPGLISYIVFYVIGRFIAGTWKLPVIGALAPLLFVVSALGIEGNVKWCWPWTSFRLQLVVLERNAMEAAGRLHLPSDRALTKNEIDRLQNAAPLRANLRFPITHWTVVASKINPWGDRIMADGQFWMWWGDKTFGPFNLKTMTILWGDD